MNKPRTPKQLELVGLTSLAIGVLAVAAGFRWVRLETVLLGLAQGLFWLGAVVYVRRRRERLAAEIQRMEEPWVTFAVLLPVGVFWGISFMIQGTAIHQWTNYGLLRQALNLLVYLCSFGATLGVGLARALRHAESIRGNQG